MTDQKAIWQGMFKSTLNGMRLCLLIACGGFWLAGAISTVNSQDTALTYLFNNITIILMLLFSVGAFGTFLAIRSAVMNAPKLMSFEMQTKHEQSLRKMRGIGVLFTMMAVICNTLTTSDVLLSYFSGSILSAAVFAISLAFLALSLLCQKMASSIKLKHLN